MGETIIDAIYDKYLQRSEAAREGLVNGRTAAPGDGQAIMGMIGAGTWIEKHSEEVADMLERGVGQWARAAIADGATPDEMIKGLVWMGLCLGAYGECEARDE